MKSVLVKKLVISNCKVKVNKKAQCFLYNFDLAGIVNKNLEKSFNGMTLYVYKFAHKKIAGRKCFWCGKKLQDASKLLSHTLAMHQKTSADLELLRIQKELYSMLLKSIKAKKEFFQFIFTWRSCQMCVNPITKGREGLCAIPESARNKCRSLKELGFDCDGFLDKWKSDRYGFIMK